MELNMSILVINAGSSSIKIGIFNSTSKKITQTHSGFVDWEEKHPSFSLSLNGRREKKLLLDKKNRQACLKDLFEHLQTLFPVFKCIGHRVVHGGDYFSKPTRINSNVKRKIKDLKNLAPMHNPIELLCIDLAERTWEKTPNFAVFDTAFFRQISEISSLYPLSYRFKQKKNKEIWISWNQP